MLTEMYIIQEFKGIHQKQSYFKEWFLTINKDNQNMAKSMISCLKIIGLKCIYVKAIDDIKGLFELRSKSTGVRVYFFIDENKAIILNGTVKTYKKKDILIQRNDIQIAARLMNKYFNDNGGIYGHS